MSKELNISIKTLYSHIGGHRKKAKNFLIKKLNKNETYPLKIPPYIRGKQE